MWLPRELRTGEGRIGSFGLVNGKPLHIQWINNKVLLYSTGNNIQCPVIKHSDKNIKKNVYMCKTESLCYTAEINTAL